MAEKPLAERPLALRKAGNGGSRGGSGGRFLRRDFRVRCERTGEGVHLTVETEGLAPQHLSLARLTSEAEVARGAPRQWLRHQLEDWRTRRGRAPGSRSSANKVQWRIALQVQGPALAALDWEAWLQPLLEPDEFLIRVAPTRPRALNLPLTFPVRMLEVGAREERSFDLQQWSASVGPRLQELLAAGAFISAQSLLPALEDFRSRSEWPTAEVLHFHRLPLSPDHLLRTAAVEEPGTLGWLLRLADSWQTRLVILAVEQQQVPRARALAQGFVERAGCAVVVADLSSAEVPDALKILYLGLLEDLPLDAIARLIRALRRSVRLSWFLGAGREEILSRAPLGKAFTQALRTDDLHKVLLQRQQDLARYTTIFLSDPLPRAPLPRAPQPLSALLGDMQKHWPQGTRRPKGADALRLASDVLALRRAAGLGQGRKPLEKPRPEGQFQQSPRYVNPSFWETRADSEPLQLEQKTARLVQGHEYLLGLRIGARDTGTYVVDAAALVEEIFKWTPDMEGVWLQVGVTGLDFEVLGSPVQELWLPREGDSELIHFNVRPLATPVARLRFCVYLRNTLLQSYRLAALCSPKPGRDAARATRAGRLAEALGLEAKQVPDVGFLSRLEFRVEDLKPGVEEMPERALSIVANDLGDGPAVTLKSDDFFDTRREGSLPRLVQNVRRTLEAIAGTSNEEGDTRYAFGIPGDPNAGTPQKLKADLQRLAAVGSQLFGAVVREDRRPEVQAALFQEGSIIQVAHILLEKSLPWSVVYDKPYDKDAQDDAGRPLPQDACLAPLAADGPRHPRQCGTHPACALHEKNRGAKTEKTVACPLGFWGLRHMVELPPLQVAPGSTGSGQRTSVGCVRPAKFIGGFNGRLVTAPAHVQRLREVLERKESQAAWSEPVYRRAPLLKALEAEDPDLVYLYCHAASERDGLFEPHLIFQGQADPKPGIITPEELSHQTPWKHHPLVILNGCETAGFSIDALSPFITKLVEGRGAAGVLGTEIRVFALLASEMGTLFVERFLQEKTWAGKALLDTRWALLRRHNVLGLIYTLYAASELSLP